jgi:hypothetical protein
MAIADCFDLGCIWLVESISGNTERNDYALVPKPSEDRRMLDKRRRGANDGAGPFEETEKKRAESRLGNGLANNVTMISDDQGLLAGTREVGYRRPRVWQVDVDYVALGFSKAIYQSGADGCRKERS